MNAFERQVSGVITGLMGPVRPVDDLAVFNTITDTSPRWRFQPMFSATKFVVAGVIVALFGGFLASGILTQEAPSVPGAATGDAGTFSRAGSLAQPRAFHTATLLPDGRVLIVGGSRGDDEDDFAESFDSAEVWDPTTASFSPAGSLAEARYNATATLLPDGRVLIAGGHGRGGFLPASAEVWDPTTSTFSPTGSLAQPRMGHTATLLPDGRVLVLGGGDDSHEVFFRSAEVWDPTTSTFSPAGSLASHSYDAATDLPDGRVLIVEGCGERCDSRLGSAEVWDPGTDTFSPAGSLATGWIGSATLLSDGRVLVISGDEPTAAEVWDPDTDTFSPAGEMAVTRGRHSATALPDGRVLVVGGRDAEDEEILDSVEIWDPETESFRPSGEMAVTRSDHTATALPDGRVLVVGGWGDDLVHASAEVWDLSDG